MKTLITALMITLSSSLSSAMALPVNIECRAGLVGLGDTVKLTKVNKYGTTAFSGTDEHVQFWVLAKPAEMNIEVSTLQPNYRSTQEGPALMPGQAFTQIFQLNIAGANTAYFLNCEAH